MTPPLEPRPRILDEVPSTGHLVLEASAGTGKTYALEHLVIDLLVEGEVELSELLVVTFTERATEELRSRLRRRLRQLARAGDDRLRDAGWELDDEQRRLLDESLARLDDLHISTIHGFCQGLLHDLAFRHRRLFQQELVDGERLLRRVFREELRETLGRSTRRAAALERVLREGVTVDDLENRVARICHFRGDGVTPIWDPEGIGELVEAARSLLRAPRLAEDSGDEIFSALETLAGRLEELPDPVDPLNVGAAWLEAEREEPTTAARELLVDRGARWSRDLLATLRSLDDRAGEPADLVASAFREPVLDRARERKATQGWYDFDDMLELVAEALRRPGDEVGPAVRERYRLALIDEFQDTDPVQWEIFRRLFPPDAEDQRLVLIGDPKQAIYGFRNADVAVYQRALESIRDAGGSVHALTRNFRSTPRMLEAQERLFRDFFDEDTGFTPPEPGRPELSSKGPRGREAPPVVLFRPFTTGSRKLSHRRFNETVAQEIVREIRRIVDEGVVRMVEEAEKPRSIDLGEIQILARRNREVETVAEHLRDAGVPYTLYRQEGLFDTEEARHIHVLLRAISRPRDRAARLRAWLTPFFQVPLDRLPEAREAPEDHPLRERLAVWRRRADEEPLTVLFRSLLRDSGLTRRLLFSESGHRRLTNYEHVLEILAEEAHESALELPDVLSLLADFRSGRARPARSEGTVQRVEGEREAVQVLTMHKAKGLEATVVFLFGGLSTPRIKPGSRNPYRIDDERRAHLGRAVPRIEEAVEEERRREDQRLLYVAATRARARLYLPYPGPGEVRGDRRFGTTKYGGTYLQMDRRLQAVLEGTDEPGDLFRLRELPYRKPDSGATTTGPEPDLGLLSRELLAAEPPIDPRALRRLRRERAPTVVTSYTRLSRLAAGASHRVEDDLSSERGGEIDETVEEDDDGLPGGLATGLFLHEVLEGVDFQAVRESEDLDRWRRDPDASELLPRLARRHGLGSEHLSEARRLVWTALRAPLRLDGLDLPRGLAEVERRVAEMEFLLPIPEPGHPLPGAAGDPGGDPGEGRFPFRVERGFLQGIIDLSFEHGGRIYFLDWKSDRRADWSEEGLAEHVDRHYDLQRRLYTLAVGRTFDLRDEQAWEERFGGLLYCFLRGMEPGSSRGVYFSRPGWNRVIEWERDLLQRRYPT